MTVLLYFCDISDCIHPYLWWGRLSSLAIKIVVFCVYLKFAQLFNLTISGGILTLFFSERYTIFLELTDNLKCFIILYIQFIKFIKLSLYIR